MVRMDEERRLGVTLKDLFTLVPRFESDPRLNDAWLTGNLMAMLVEIIATPYRPGGIWVCDDVPLRIWVGEVEKIKTFEELEKSFSDESIEEILPCREITEDATPIVFFHCPKGYHIMTFGHTWTLAPN